jgi:hypothetical protein
MAQILTSGNGAMMTRQISDKRKTAFYLGTGFMILGGILFASTFLTFMIHFGDFSNFESNAKSGMLRALGGMALLLIGGVIRGIGALGAAGSGVVLDPEKARQELEPYSRMAGGMVKDALTKPTLTWPGRPRE